jgi:hypothetical protein
MPGLGLRALVDLVGEQRLQCTVLTILWPLLRERDAVLACLEETRHRSPILIALFD